MFCFLIFFFSHEEENVPEYFITVDGAYEYYINLTTNTATLTNILKDFENLHIPSTIQHENKDYPVVQLILHEKLTAFLNGSLTIPSSITYIGSEYFLNQGISSLIFSEGSNIKTIDSYGFEYSTLTGVLKIPSSLETIGTSAFKGTQITSLEFEANSVLQTIKDSAFLETSLIGEISFPQDLVTIGSYSFYQLNISKITLGKAITDISTCAFEYSGLECDLKFYNSMYIGPSSFSYTNIKNVLFGVDPEIKIGTAAFEQCRSLVITAGVMNAIEIGYRSFAMCTSLTNLILFGNKIILEYAFYGCSSLQTVEIEDNEKRTISDKVFMNCDSLRTVIIGRSQYYYKDFICNCSSLETITISGAGYENEISISNCPKLKEITLDNDHYIFENAFSDFPSLRVVNFKNSNITFKQYSFSNCPSLKSINIDENSRIIEIKSYAFYKCSLLDFDCSNILSMESYAFQDSCYQRFTFTMSVIPSYAITGSSTLKYIRIASSVTRISPHFIEQCPNFKSLEFLDLDYQGNNLSIDDEAFWKINTFELASRLPERLINIGQESFSGCTGITGSLFIPTNLISIGSNAFANCNGLNGILDFTNCTKLEIISSYAFLGCSSLSGSLVLPNSLIEIGAYAFSNCNFAGPLIIPDKVTIINRYAFALCSTFTGSLIIGNNVEYIGDYAFSECSGFNGQLEIHTKILKEIGNNAFFSCSSLKGTLNLPDTLISIGNFAFFNCQGLENKLTLPDSLFYIGDSAFAYCTGFTQVLELPKNILYIGRNAFLLCKGFTEIHFDKETYNNESIVIGDKAFGNLEIKCLSNVPPTCQGNSTDDNRCYDSTGFNMIQEKSSKVAESCELNNAIEITITIFTVIVGSGAIGIITTFVQEWFNNIYSIKKRLSAIFESILKWSKEKYEKDRDENEIVEITIKELHKYIEKESKNPKFNLNENKLKDLLEDSFKTVWSSVPYDVMENVIENGFKGIDFESIAENHKLQRKKERCSCLKKLCQKKEESEISPDVEGGVSLSLL
ncbi:leucine-rich repeat domain-containing protein [Histomonas meleagridis]|uniref:leucine-rich repeat domain-containing protein n=1 Tax=Histomonas meleagridis TaxID=135588 RepID=UPI00355A8386|nr:leucine-rich repeat domain-containing protein [Histomonas meleagridis]KAH0806537.1 leucine-rich repeat domain-containing protein [Histomonas meleagridis]